MLPTIRLAGRTTPSRESKSAGAKHQIYYEPFESLGGLGSKVDALENEPAPIFEIRCFKASVSAQDCKENAFKIFHTSKNC